MVRVLRQNNPIHIAQSYFSKIHFQYFGCFSKINFHYLGTKKEAYEITLLSVRLFRSPNVEINFYIRPRFI
jgi:hypothetical protein